MNKEERISITFGDAGENHAGMELLGSNKYINIKNK